MNKQRFVTDPEEAQASSLVPRRYREMADAFERLRERHGR